jgi:glutathione S-transferase
MITLYSYPELYNVADNNPYGLKTFAFLKLTGLPFRHEHLFDASKAPRSQLPYIDDDGTTIGDSDVIIAYLTRRYLLTIDKPLTPSERVTDHLVRRTLDDLYWVMSYSRWKDPKFWPLFRDALQKRHPNLTEEALAAAQAYNFQRYYYQGIGRYEPDDVYHRGVGDLEAIASLLGSGPYLFGEQPRSTDAGIYGFIANIHFYEIETPLKRFVASQPDLIRLCGLVHAAVSG